MPDPGKKMKAFEWHVRFIWPFQRRFVRHLLSRRCSRCLLSEKFSPFKKGLCAECRTSPKEPRPDPQPVENRGALTAELNTLFKSHEGKGIGKYDALVLFSGGKDSTYLLYKLRHQHPRLRLLAFTVDNGFLSPVARMNLLPIVTCLEADHILYRPAVKLFKKAFRYALTHLGGRGCYEVVDRFDGELVHDIARNFAARSRIPLLVSGVSRTQVERILEVRGFESPRRLERIPKDACAGLRLDAIFDREEMRYWWNPGVFSEDAIPRVIFPFYAWELGETAIQKEVQRLGLIKSGSSNPLVTNNTLVPVMGVVDVLRLGYSSFEPEFAQMVREGKTERKRWLYIFEMLEYAAKTGWLIKDEVDKVLKELDLTREEVLRQ